MAKRPANLPDFERPPITEVVLSIQFEALPKLGNAHAGLLWNRLRDQYPVQSEHPPITPAFETFGSTPSRPQTTRLQVETLFAPPMQRYWFEEAGGHELIQLQQDRFLHNWRKQENEQHYPRFEAIFERFKNEIDIFESFLQEEGLGEVKPNQCEVTYINIVSSFDDADLHRQLERITPFWAGAPVRTGGVELENASIHAHFVLRDGDKPIGRVHVILSPAHRRSDLAPVVRLEITARGRPAAESANAAFELLERERAEVVQMFANVTTPEMHRIWERTDAS